LFEEFKSRTEVMEDYKKANILLLLVNNSPNAKACIPGKTFEYLATGKPIICLAPKGAEVADALYDDNNLILSYEDQPSEIVPQLKTFISKVQANSGLLEVDPMFSRRSLTGKLAAILDATIA